jgi:fibronectin-binding autotransporter adhesin
MSYKRVLMVSRISAFLHSSCYLACHQSIGLVIQGLRCLTVLILLTPSLLADYWQVESGDWSVSENWSGGLPTSDSNLCISNGQTATITLPGAVCASIAVGSNETSGILLMTGGSFSSSATSTSLGAIWLGFNPGASGAFTLSDGQMSVSHQHVGQNGGTGNFYQTGGINTANYVCVGANMNSVGTYILSGTGQLIASGEILGDNGGTGTFTQTGGTNTVNDNFILGDNPGSTGIYNLNGGTLIISGIQGSGNPPVFNFGGGTLQVTDNYPIIYPLTLTGIGGNANINCANHWGVTISGPLSGLSGLNKLGADMLTLTAANTYSGPTTICTGTLSLGSAGSLDSCMINIVAGATYNVSAVSNGYHLKNLQTLAGTGTVNGNLAVDAGGHIAPGNAPDAVGTLKFNGNLSLGSGALLDFDLAATNGSDLISLSSSKLLLSNQQFTDFNFTTWNGFGPGIYTLIDADSIQGSLGINLSGNIHGFEASLYTSGGDLLLTIVPEPSSCLLLGIGTISVLGYVWRRRKHGA